MGLITENLFFNSGHFCRLICSFNIVFNLLFNKLDGPAFDWEELHKLFNRDEFGASFLDSHQSLFESFHGYIAGLWIIAFSPDKGIFLELKNFIEQDFSNELMRVKILFALIEFGNDLTNDLIDSLGHISKAHLLLLF